MNRERLEREVQSIASLPGIRCCALIEADGGLPWCGSGPTELLALTEAAVDHWRLTVRNAGAFAPLGSLRSQVLMHALGRVTLVACPGQLLLVTISAEPNGADWARWKAGVQQLHTTLRELLPAAPAH